MIAGVFYTLEDFLTHTDGVTYLIIGGFLLLFVWFPFWMTGPVVGSIIGFLIGLGPWTTMAVVLTGTGLAIVCWVFVLNQVFVQLRALGPYVPFVFVALILLIAISIHIRQYFGGRANGTLRQPRDQD